MSTNEIVGRYVEVHGAARRVLAVGWSSQDGFALLFENSGGRLMAAAAEGLRLVAAPKPPPTAIPSGGVPRPDY